MTIRIDKTILENACKSIIEAILSCLPNAYKGTVYGIGGPPDMVAVRITSGVMDAVSKTISWGLPERSDYNPPGKPWREYRDEPFRPLEAMGWCVKRQKSWTAEDPPKDRRSVRLQVEGVWEDYHHMEPVLIRKTDLYLGTDSSPEFPRNYQGEILWKDSEYAVIAVIKIHFRPNTIKIGGPETRIIKRLSRALGTELLSYQLRQQSVEAMRQLAQDKLNSCNILADSLRNTITKSGLIFSLIKLELGFLREQWESVLLENSEQREMKKEAIRLLNEEMLGLSKEADGQAKDLIGVQNHFLELSLPPRRGENWVKMQIEERWEDFFRKHPPGEEPRKRVGLYLDLLKKSLYVGKDQKILAAYDKLPEDLKREWTDLIYRDTDRIDFQFLDRLIHLLDDPSLNLPHQEKSKKSLIHLKTLAQVMGQLEQDTNVVLRQVLNGCADELTLETLNPVGL